MKEAGAGQQGGVSGRLGRLLDLLNYLQSGHAMTARALASACGVSRRTIFRDLRILRDAGLELRYDERQAGYVATDGPDREIPAGLSREELFAVCLVSQLTSQSETNVPQPLRSQAWAAASKLAGLLPRRERARLRRRARAISIELRPQGNIDRKRLEFEALWKAIETRCCARIRYEEEAGEPASTLLSPYRLVFGDDGWSVLGRSSRDRCVRRFALMRIQSVELTEQRFRIPPRLPVRQGLRLDDRHRRTA